MAEYGKHLMAGGALGLILVGTAGCVGEVGAGSPEFSTSPLTQPTAVFPVRVPRAWVEAPLVAEFRLAAATAVGPAIWEREPTDLPPPDGSQLADFRDEKECARIDSADGFRVCFSVAADVSTLEASERKISLIGVQDLLRQLAPAGCNPMLQNVEWSGADRQEDGFSFRYKLTTVEESGSCSGVMSGSLQTWRLEIAFHP